MPTLRMPGRRTGHGGQALGARALRVASHNRARERAPLPVPGVRPCVASKHERSGRSAREALACGGALGSDGRGRSSCDGGAHRPGPRCVLEEPPTPLSWVKASVY